MKTNKDTTDKFIETLKTLLETKDDMDEFNIKRTDKGWIITFVEETEAGK